uniref:Uncharacterized protein n=1 Tax=Parascaris univalens TaxID=6257 RepID=A0A915CF68_PARUN
ATINLLPGVGRHFYVTIEVTANAPLYGLTERLKGRAVAKAGLQVQCRGAKSLADDLITGQGVVSSRAASILRSVETHPLIGRF